MIKCTVVLFSRDTNGKRFTKKCLKQIAKDNEGKVAKVAGGMGIVDCIRYHKGQVIANFSLPLHDISCTGKIIEEVKDKVTQFRVEKVELIEVKIKEVSDE